MNPRCARTARWIVQAAVSTLGVALVLVGLPAVLTQTPASALSGGDFEPGYIISDERFFASGSMTEAEVQAFLNARVPSCNAIDPNLPCLRDLTTSTSHRAATAYCRAYRSEGWESSARILVRVAQACNINPQVLIVMLEKEQSLVTTRRPTSYQYQRAMGFACPDTAPCDAQYFGFFNQVYAAASRLQQYTQTPSRWNYRIGANLIQYHPLAACGASIVHIRNQATANLYIYTPYQPNKAALDNLYGTGDACSTYGNRNFWRLYSQWFGPPTAQGTSQIDAEHARRASTLGAPTSDYLSIGSAGSARAYQNGSIYWTAATGARSVYGPVKTLYFRRGGATGTLGWPISDIDTYHVASSGETGVGQAYQSGSIFSWSRGTFDVPGGFRSVWVNQWGGVKGALGWPISTAAVYPSNGGGEGQAFEHGSMFKTSGRTFVVREPIRAHWVARGGVGGRLGWPISEQARYTANGGGTGQAFAGGSVFVTSTGVFVVEGEMRTWWVAQGGVSGRFGWPIAVMNCDGGTCSQQFQGGQIHWDTASGRVFGVVEPQLTSYLKAGGVGGPLGPAISSADRYGANGGGVGQAFRAGSIFTTSRGTNIVMDPLRAVWVTAGGVAGRYGWPLGDAVRYSGNGGGTGQPFQGGSFFSSASGTYPVPVGLRELWVARGGVNGPDGWPIGQPVSYADHGGGRAQAFQHGSVFASAAGTYMVSGRMRTTWVSQGGVQGRWGWPTSAMTCRGSVCSQSFQGGTLTIQA